MDTTTSSLKAFLHLAPVHPMSRSRRTVEDLSKPLHPTSTGHVVAIQLASLHSFAKSAYFACFHSVAQPPCLPPMWHWALPAEWCSWFWPHDQVWPEQTFCDLPGEMELPPQVGPDSPLAAWWEDCWCHSLAMEVDDLYGICEHNGTSGWGALSCCWLTVCMTLRPLPAL